MLPENRFYVYSHLDPSKKDIVYVGKGSGQRAWMMRNSGKGPAYGHRSKEHYEWYCSMEQLGYLMNDIVLIEDKFLSEARAAEIEKELIAILMPKYNKMKGPGSYRNQEFADKCLDLEAQGVSFSNIAKQVGVSTMTAWRACRGL